QRRNVKIATFLREEIIEGETQFTTEGMTMWKDILPEYEPGNDSWKKLEDSLHLDEQLRRTLPELPAYEPQENSWDGIMIKLLPSVSRLSRYSGIAAAVLILIVAGTFFLLKRNEIHEDRISGKGLLQ